MNLLHAMLGVNARKIASTALGKGIPKAGRYAMHQHNGEC